MKQIQANMPAEKTWHNASFVRSFRRNAKETAAESYKTKYEPEVYRGLQANATEHDRALEPDEENEKPSKYKKKTKKDKKKTKKEKSKKKTKKEKSEKKTASKKKAVRYLCFIFL